MSWLLTICTAGALGLCGLVRTVEYPTEQACYKALHSLYKEQGGAAFQYVLCAPKEETK